jgi:hypothetical protein
MHTGSELVETWIPTGGFRIERRKVRTQDGSAIVTECLVPRWDIGELDLDSLVHGNPASTGSSPTARRSANQFSIWQGATVCLPSP